MENYYVPGRQFVLARKLAGMTQNKAAWKSGLSQSEISNIENDKKRNRFRKLQAFYEALGVVFLEDGTNVILGHARKPPAENKRTTHPTLQILLKGLSKAGVVSNASITD